MYLLMKLYFSSQLYSVFVITYIIAAINSLSFTSLSVFALLNIASLSCYLQALHPEET